MSLTCSIWCTPFHTNIEYHERCILGMISIKWLSRALPRVALGMSGRRMDRHETDIVLSTQREWHSIFIIWYHFDKAPSSLEKAIKLMSTWRGGWHSSASMRKDLHAHLHCNFGCPIQKDHSKLLPHSSIPVLSAYICLSKHLSTHFKQLIKQK